MTFSTAETHSAASEGRHLHAVIQPILPRFEWLVRFHALFHIGSWILLGLECILIFLFFTFLTQSMLMAFSLSTLFLTFFSYLMLRLYFQAIKPEQMQALKTQFLDTYKTLTNCQEEAPEHLLSLSH